MKIYLDASLKERARRRQLELNNKGHEMDLKQVESDTARRDTADKTRYHGPLKIAPDAIVVDTTGMSIEQVVAAIALIVEGISNES